MSGQHTPGPWWIDASDKRHGDHRVSCRSGMVALVGNGANIGEARHDARLISAAPDLLAALDSVTGFLADFAFSCGGEQTEGKDDEWGALRKARAAIALARTPADDAAGGGE